MTAAMEIFSPRQPWPSIVQATNCVLGCRFHEIEPQTDLAMLPPGPSSVMIVQQRPRAVPTPILQENTLVISECMVLTSRNGKLMLMIRYRQSLTQ